MNLPSLFNERNEEFNQYQDMKYGPINPDVIMKSCMIREDSVTALTLNKQQKRELIDKHVDRKLKRWDFLGSLSWESIYYGFAHVNLMYLMLFTFFNFVIFRYLGN